MGANCSRQVVINDEILLAAVRDGNEDVVRQNLASTRLLMQPTKLYLWADHVLALHIASNEGHLGVIKALVEAAQPTSTSKYKHRSLFHAFVNHFNTYGQTPLMLACKNGHDEVVKYLLHVGADPLLPDKVHQRTCLHYAAWNGWASCIKILLSERCKVRLHNGLIGGAHEAIVNDACGSQRMVDIRSESGFTPLHFAVSASKTSAVKVLLEKGALLTSEVLQGASNSIWPIRSTPLHIAAVKGSASVVKLLLQAQENAADQADMRSRPDINGKLPLHLARQHQHSRLEHMLDPAVPLRHALHAPSRRHARTQGPPSLSVLAGKAVQVALLGQLDYLAWQLRLRDGAEAAMPSSLRRQLLKSSKTAAVASMNAGRPLGGRTSDGLDDKSEPGSHLAEVQAAPLTPEDGEADSAKEDCGTPKSLLATPTEDLEVPALQRGSFKSGSPNECGVCLDRQTQLLFGGCSHECCYECAMSLVKKTRLSKGAVRCPYCRSVIGSLTLKDKSRQPVMIQGSSKSFSQADAPTDIETTTAADSSE